jgi:hypothetical protein
MPTFRTSRPVSLAQSMRLLLGNNRNLSGMDEIAISRAASEANRSDSLAEKARFEIQQAREAESRRNDPARATEYAATSSGLRVPEATQLARFIRGEHMPNPTGVDDEGTPLETIEAPRPGSVTPESERAFRSALASVMANNLATGKTNADQMTQAGGNLLTQAIRSEMTRPGTAIPRENQLGHAINIRAREPYATNAQGTVLDQETGALDEGTDLAAAVRGNIGAQAGQRRAAAGLSGERATDLRTTRPGRQALTDARATQAREGRPAPRRTPAQERRDSAYASRAEAAATAAGADNNRRREAAARSNFRKDPAMKGHRLGRWTEQGFEVLDSKGTLVGYYDDK